MSARANLFAVLAQFADGDGLVSNLPLVKLAALLGRNRETVRQAIISAAADGVITIISRGRGRAGFVLQIGAPRTESATATEALRSEVVTRLVPDRRYFGPADHLPMVAVSLPRLRCLEGPAP